MPAKKKKTDTPADDSAEESKSVDEQKDNALNLFEEEEKREARRGKSKKAPVKEEASVFDHLKKDAKASAESGGDNKVEASDEDDDEDDDVPVVIEDEESDKKIIHIKPPIVVKDLAELMDIKPFKLIQELMELEVFANQNQSIEPDVAEQVCEKYGFVFEKEKREKGGGVHKEEEVIVEPEAPAIEEVEEDELKPRPPVVTFMGHVDHGKTSLLDFYRGSKVADGEAGGITQHVGAYQVERNGQKVTFLDTPGHEAFSAMRARGANVTDIVVLVVAADDGLMPTTFEAIDHCKAADVQIIVAINKIDLDRANVDKVKGQLQEHDLAPEDWGGSTICAEVSAKEGTGMDELYELIGLQAEILELKGNPAGPARGTVIEASTEPGKGATATIIVQTGTLKKGVPFICGNHHGKVKAMLTDTGEQVDKAPPGTPVEVVGFDETPSVGDELVQMESERHAKKLSSERREEERQEKLAPAASKSALETLFANIEDGKKKVLKVILKADVQGSIEAIVKALYEIESDKISLDVIRQDAGPITESDIILASASDAILIGFNTKVENKAVPIARREGVQVKLYSIIYELIDQVKDAMLGMLDPETREHVIGHANVLEVFKLSSGKVAGCMVTDGRIDRKARARVLRDGQPVYDGGVHTLRRFKDDVKEVRNGLECGIRLGNYNDYTKDDVIECYELESLDKSL
ncbi:MAG: translation initiation factor IF-2 [Verrucomicrobiales bacterium]|nr:translation initiation factor IF-2 [Verrucomicrobiales bacterium]